MSSNKKPLILNGFIMNVVGHVSAGLWRHPQDRACEYLRLDYWTGIAKLLDEAGFHSIFIADALGQLDVYGGSADTALRTAAQTPVNDPLLLVSAIAGATRHLSIGVTVSATYEHPYLLARKFTTLDHLTQGRVAWNVVTSVLESAARNLGLDQQMEHDERYDRAQEFLDVTYKLWEGSWEQDAVRRDKIGGVYADPTKVHPIGHEGKYFRVPGAHLSEPSAQRTPVIFQAGTSERGREFAARNAEVVFLGGVSAEDIRANVARIRTQGQALGRGADAIRFITAVTVITASTDALAKEKFEDLSRYTDTEAALALFSAWTGVDWSIYPSDHPLEYIETNAGRSALRNFSRIDAGKRWTVGEVARYIGIGGLHPVIVGGPTAVADQLEAYAEASGVDGFNLAYAISPGTFEDFVTHIVPELRRRGRLRAAPDVPLTLRERLQGEGQRHLRDDHPAARFRHLVEPVSGNAS